MIDGLLRPSGHFGMPRQTQIVVTGIVNVVFPVNLCDVIADAVMRAKVRVVDGQRLERFCMFHYQTKPRKLLDDVQLFGDLIARLCLAYTALLPTQQLFEQRALLRFGHLHHICGPVCHAASFSCKILSSRMSISSADMRSINDGS